MTYARNIHGDWSYMPTNGTEQRDFNVVPTGAAIGDGVRKLNKDIAYQREKGNMYSTKDKKFGFNGLDDEYPLCTGGCSRFQNHFVYEKGKLCSRIQTVYTNGKPANCFSNEPL